LVYSIILDYWHSVQLFGMPSHSSAPLTHVVHANDDIQYNISFTNRSQQLFLFFYHESLNGLSRQEQSLYKFSIEQVGSSIPEKRVSSRTPFI